MLREELKSIKSSSDDLREFGLTVGAAFLVLGCLLLRAHRVSCPYFLAIGAALILLGLAIPIALRPVQRPWMAFSIVMGYLMTQVLMGLLFFILVTPIGFVSRLFGQNFLDLRIDRGRSSYWEKRSASASIDPSQYEKQF